MKSLRLSDALIFSALFVLSTAYADKAVHNATITPDEFFTHTLTTITVSAEIASGHPLPSSINVYQTTANGKPVLKLGQMSVTDKKYGASSKFSLQFDVNKPKQETLYIKIITDYGGKTRYQGAIMPINAYERISAANIQQYEAILKTLKQAHILHQAKLPAFLARQKTYQAAKNNPAIQQVKINGDFLSILFKQGVRGSIKLDKFNFLENTVKNTTAPLLPGATNNSGKQKLLIFAPGYSDASPQNHIADLAQSLFNQSTYLQSGIQAATVIKDSQASLEVIKHWGDYQTVILHTHGGVWGIHPSTEEVFLLSGTSSLAPLTEQNALDLSTGRIGIKGLDKFIIFPNFIAKYASPMQDSFFYLGACYSLANNTMWQALQNKGAKVAFGWNSSVARGFNADTFKRLLSPMLAINATPDIITVKQAYNAIPDKVDGWCPFKAICLGGEGATLTLKTATPAWEQFAFSNSGLMVSKTSEP